MEYKPLVDLMISSGVHSDKITLAAAIGCLVLFIITWLLQRWILPRERWARLLGFVFLAWVLQNVCEGLLIRQDLYDLLPGYTLILGSVHFLKGLSSTLANLLMVATSLSLLGERGELRVRIPQGYFGWALLALVGSVLPFAFGKLFDTTLTCWSLCYLAYAFAQNFGRKSWALLSYMTLGGYGLVVFATGLIPFTDVTSLSFVEQIRIQSLQQGTYLLAIDVLAGSSLFLLGLFKIGVFLAGFTLLLKCLGYMMPRGQEVVGARSLSAEGLPKHLSQVVGAQRASLWIKEPGGTSMGQRYSWDGQYGRESISRIPDSTEPMGPAFTEGEPVTLLDTHLKQKEVYDNYHQGLHETRSLVAVPIKKLKDIVLGCLVAEWDKRMGYTATTIVRMEQLADAIAEAVHIKRQKIALQKIRETSDGLTDRGLSPLVAAVIERIRELLALQAAALRLYKGKEVITGYSGSGEFPIHEAEDFAQWIECRENEAPDQYPLSFEESQSSSALTSADLFLVKGPKADKALLDDPAFVNGLVKQIQDTILRQYTYSLAADKSKAVLEAENALFRVEKLELQMEAQNRPALLMHEFANQMEVLRGNISNLNDDLLLEEYDKAVKRIPKLDDAARGLMELARSQNRNIRTEDERPALVSEFIEKVLTGLRELHRHRNISVEVPELPKDLWVDISKETATLTFSNLIKNATDEIRRNGTITIELEFSSEIELQLHVSNPGKIPDEHREKIFERGYTTKGERGTGLGLYLCRKALERDGGHLVLTSSAGPVTFTMIMPLVEGDQDEQK